MNVIGEMGNFIIKYQEPLQTGVIIALILASVVIIAKLFSNARKKREILSQINSTVSEINTAVNHLHEKKAEVIYIDSRMSQGTGEADAASVTNRVLDPEITSAEENASAKDSGTEMPEAAPEEATLETPLKYFSRDCGISKNGKQFTIEELNAQIRE